MRLVTLLAISAVASLLWPREQEARERGSRPVATAVAAHAESVPAPEPQPEPKDPPPEAQQPPPGVERGPCKLRLELIDDVTGELVTSKVELWRVDLRETAVWTSGDQLQATVRVPGGFTLAGLPRGRYRLFIHEQRFTAEDPAWFWIAGDLTTIVQPVPRPRKHRAFVRVFNEDGKELDEGKISGGRPSGRDLVASSTATGAFVGAAGVASGAVSATARRNGVAGAFRWGVSTRSAGGAGSRSASASPRVKSAVAWTCLFGAMTWGRARTSACHCR